MADIKEITLVLDMDNEQERNMYEGIVRFARRHNIQEESSALKTFISFLQFKGEDVTRLNSKLQNKFSTSPVHEATSFQRDNLPPPWIRDSGGV